MTFPWAETDSGERYVVRDFVQFVHRDQTVVGKIKNFNLAGEVCININLYAVNVSQYCELRIQ